MSSEPVAPKEQGVEVIRDEIRKVILDAILEHRYEDAIRILASRDYRTSLGRRTLCPCYSHDPIPPGNLEVVVSRPQLPFKPSRLLISPGISAYFTVTDIKKGQISYLVAPGDVSADLFSMGMNKELYDKVAFVPLNNDGYIQVLLTQASEELFGLPVDIGVVTVGQSLLVTVQNNSRLPQVFHSLFLGSGP